MLLMGERAEHVPDTMGTATPLAFGNLMPPNDLRRVRDYADVIGPSNKDIIPRDADGAWSTPTSLIDDAHRAGLLVHSYTLRTENRFLPAQLRNAAGTMPETRRDQSQKSDAIWTWVLTASLPMPPPAAAFPCGIRPTSHQARVAGRPRTSRVAVIMTASVTTHVMTCTPMGRSEYPSSALAARPTMLPSDSSHDVSHTS
ncbi:hypothetical protein MSKU3_1328 [Komagataeibacter oboediens]|nr:hypothetical protein MSKU3_1328 [Komagataeibacter oboediens]